ncbi:hypothetical protein BD310DRAFT_812504 [Dichomitus squalens]|uniref:Uncharacterized protein n=1 Tax=Dichomitus squalens TaxID=114155 RepID=A0A4Q9Q5Q2_9APHY|nr:hypothetical protein BD310DRAFT_812504 [Dichomitus squalens]
MEAAIGKLDIIRILRDGYVQQAHNWRRPVTRAVVQAYQVWKKRLQVSERLAVKRKAIGIMEEVGPAPLEEVFLVRPTF